jgi:hypothetical protein
MRGQRRRVPTGHDRLNPPQPPTGGSRRDEEETPRVTTALYHPWPRCRTNDGGCRKAEKVLSACRRAKIRIGRATGQDVAYLRAASHAASHPALRGEVWSGDPSVNAHIAPRGSLGLASRHTERRPPRCRAGARQQVAAVSRVRSCRPLRTRPPVVTSDGITRTVRSLLPHARASAA